MLVYHSADTMTWHTFGTDPLLPDCCARFLQIFRQPILVKGVGEFSLWTRFFQSSKVLLFEWKGCRMLQHLGQNRRTSLLLPLDHSVVSMFCQHLADWPNAYLFFGKGWLERLLYFLILLTEQAWICTSRCSAQVPFTQSHQLQWADRETEVLLVSSPMISHGTFHMGMDGDMITKRITWMIVMIVDRMVMGIIYGYGSFYGCRSY